MRKIKFISIMIVSILLGAGITSIATAQELDGEIEVDIKQTLGIVSPVINLENETTIELEAELIEEENSSYYRVNDSIEINLNVTNDMENENPIFSRSVFYSAILIRKPVKIMPFGGIFGRILPIFKVGIVPVIDSMLGKNASAQIELPLNYTIMGDTLADEDMTLHLFTMGMLPGDVNGINGLKVVDYHKVTITANYTAI